MDLAGRKKPRKPLLQRRNWFVSAGLVMLIYVSLQVTLRLYWGDTTFIISSTHALPLIAVLMVLLGYIEKRQKEEQDREIKKKRYEVRMELSRIQREAKAASSQTAAPNPETGKGEKP